MKKIYTLLIALFGFVFFPFNIFGEGTKDISTPSKNTRPFICTDKLDHCNNSGADRSDFAAYNCSPSDRLNIVVDDSAEIVYFGFQIEDIFAFWSQNPDRVVYQIRNSDGEIVYDQLDKPESGDQGYINSYDECVQGPQQLGNPSGYDALVFRPGEPDTYYIEFDGVDNFGEPEPSTIELTYFDFTVVDTTDNSIKEGRLHSEAWQFWESDGCSGEMFVYSTDSIITSLEMNNMGGGIWVTYCNQTGAGTTGDWIIDRLSINNPPEFEPSPEYKLFLNIPDTNIFKPATVLGSIVGTPWGQPYCSGHVEFHVEVDKAGNVELVIDLEDPYVDRTLSQQVNEPGEIIIWWDGLDGNGTPVPHRTYMEFTVSYINGLTNLPLFDVEDNNNGFLIELVYPASADPVSVYWDDSDCGGTSNYTGCQSPPGCHTWGGFVGDYDLINTWWYTVSQTSAPVDLLELRHPDSLLFYQPPNQEYCGGQTGVVFSVHSDPNSDTVYWNFTGNDAIITYVDDTTISMDFGVNVTPGNIEATGYNDSCGFGAISPLPINVNSYPDVNLGPDTSVCDNGVNTAYFDAGPADTYLWNTGATSQVITPSTSGEYWVEAANGVCVASDTVLLTMVPEPTTFAGSDTAICQYEILDFSGLDLPPEATEVDSILWFGGTGTFDDPRTIWPLYTPAQDELGTFLLGLIGYGLSPCGNDTSYISIQIDTVPTGTITSIPVDTACIDELISFSGSSPNNVEFWEWDFGDGSPIESGQNVTHAYGEDGTFEVILSMYNEFNCLGQDTFYMVVQAIDVDINASPSPACINDTVFFHGTGDVTFTDYQWNFGNGNTAIGQDTFNIYTSPGIYTVELIVCSDTSTMEITIHPPAISDAGSNEHICEGQAWNFANSAILPDTTDAISLLWQGGAGNFDDNTALLPVYTPAPGEEGPVPLYLIAYSNAPCQHDTSFMILTLDSLPEPSFTYLPATGICVNEALQFNGQNDNTTTISTWEWDFGDGGTASVQNPLYSYSSAGTYNVKLTLTNAEGCVDSITQQVLVNELPLASISVIPGNDTICAELPFSFSGSSTTNITDWFWDFGDGVGTATGQNVSYTYNSAGNYTVQLIVINDNTCSDTVTRDVRVNALPQADFTNSPQDTTCTGDIISFSGFEISGGITNWQWQFGDGNTASGQNVNHTYTSQGDYTVLMIYSNADGCLDTASKSIRIEELDIDFTRSPSPSCQGYVVNFQGIDYNGNAGFSQWEWDFGDGSSPAYGQNTAHIYPVAGTYDVMLVVCTDTIIRSITVNPQAQADAG
ncbi:MAG: PKD domain-containing protein, partial [Bacteroidales bacterium]|nr:PKD domain-containing protein [Bacteroidales bacterium]